MYLTMRVVNHCIDKIYPPANTELLEERRRPTHLYNGKSVPQTSRELRVIVGKTSSHKCQEMFFQYCLYIGNMRGLKKFCHYYKTKGYLHLFLHISIIVWLFNSHPLHLVLLDVRNFNKNVRLNTGFAVNQSAIFLNSV
jgi:hypothetical protein